MLAKKKKKIFALQELRTYMCITRHSSSSDVPLSPWVAGQRAVWPLAGAPYLPYVVIVQPWTVTFLKRSEEVCPKGAFKILGEISFKENIIPYVIKLKPSVREVCEVKMLNSRLSSVTALTCVPSVSSSLIWASVLQKQNMHDHNPSVSK